MATPSEGTVAIRFFRVCPNNDGGASLPLNARIKIVLRDVSGNGIPGVSAADICVQFNGGTPAQGFSGIGADSIIADDTLNPTCPEVRCLQADADTDANGVTYVTFTGSVAGNPGVGVRNPNRKWGHYDSELPVYAMGVKLQGFLTSAKVDPYVLRIKNFDMAGGLGDIANAGQVVSSVDFNAVSNAFGKIEPVTYWRDVDGSGTIANPDYNIMAVHVNHDCDTPNNP